MKIFHDQFYIILQEKAMRLASLVAEKRIAENLRRPGCTDSEKCLRRTHWPGSLSELAVVLFYDREWEGMYYEGDSWRNRGNDVKGLEVKSSFEWDNICLGFDDPILFPDVPFIFIKLIELLDSNSIGAKLKGWVYGREALTLGKLKINQGSGEKYYLIMNDKFRKMEDLPI